jgi:dihydroorotate dehydrogenase (NAD+) catalytic subunit
MVFQVARALPGVPIMGIGGISDLSDVLEFLAAGASAVQIGTANFRDPGVSGRLVDELDAHCRGRGETVRSLIGRAQRAAAGGEASGGDAGAEG